jgi:hypothetical protein
MKLKRIQAGVYETEDGQHRIVRTEWDRPRRGVFYLWEHATWDATVRAWCIDGWPAERTLRAARAALEKELS